MFIDLQMNAQFSIEIIYADDAVIVVNKPAGLLSIPDGYNPSTPHLASHLASGFGKVWIVHRLDRDTSGVIIVARTITAHRELNLQFEHRQIKKIYHALLPGIPSWERIEVDTPLRVNGDRKHRTVPNPLTGKKALTSFRILSKYAHGCLVEASPHTGYTHQIRAHLASLGFPIYGDRLYQNRHLAAVEPDFPVPPNLRTCLHARSLSFDHPISKNPLTMDALYPDDFLAAIKILS